MVTNTNTVESSRGMGSQSSLKHNAYDAINDTTYIVAAKWAIKVASKHTFRAKE